MFAGGQQAHGTHGEPDERKPGDLKWRIKGSAKTLREPPTREHWQQHTAGERPLGIIPIRDDGRCSWGTIDLDVYDINLLEIVAKVEVAKLPLLPCVSKSGGLHLFLFIKQFELAGKVQDVLRAMADRLRSQEL